MASVQCYRTCEESCQQKSHHGSLGQKVSDMFKGHHNHNHHNAGTQTQTQTHCYGQSQMLPPSRSGHHSQYNAGTQCYGQNQMLPHSHSGNAANTKITQTEYRYSHSQTQTTQGIATGSTSSGRRCHGRSRRERKQGSIFQKIKDGLSGHGSDSCSSSDSGSDSDNDNCHRRKNCN